jgi:hypothetical protein
MNKDDIILGGITSRGGTIVAEGQQGVTTYALVMWRVALKAQINTGMIINPGVSAKVVLPQLVALGITDVPLTRITQKRMIRAWNDLNDFLISKGAEGKSL